MKCGLRLDHTSNRKRSILEMLRYADNARLGEFIVRRSNRTVIRKRDIGEQTFYSQRGLVYLYNPSCEAEVCSVWGRNSPEPNKQTYHWFVET